MSATFSFETKDLLERADRAIERSMELRTRERERVSPSEAMDVVRGNEPVPVS